MNTLQKITLPVILVLTFSVARSQTADDLGAVEPGVSVQLAEVRKKAISNIKYQLHFVIPVIKQKVVRT